MLLLVSFDFILALYFVSSKFDLHFVCFFKVIDAIVCITERSNELVRKDMEEKSTFLHSFRVMSPTIGVEMVSALHQSRYVTTHIYKILIKILRFVKIMIFLI